MVPLLIVLLTLVLVVLPLWALFKLLELEKKNARLEQRLAELERVSDFRNQVRSVTVADAPPPAPVAEPTTYSPPPIVPQAAPPIIVATRIEETVPPPPLPPPFASPPASPTPAASSAPLPRVSGTLMRAETFPPKRVNWEQFTGGKLLAWTGGLAAFLGAAFFIKYSFEHDLIPLGLRVALGYIFALGLVVTGLAIPRPRYAPTSQTLCATGIVCLYAVTFACNSIYHFAFFGPVTTFALMALITASAFLLAVRLRAQVVAILGMLGGFLTPVLLSTGRDNVVGLFSYIALLDIGLVGLALHQRWLFLVPLSAIGTIAMQAGWAAKFLNPAKTPTAMMVCVGFGVVFAGSKLLARRFGIRGPQLLWPAIALPCVALCFALGFIGYRTIAAQPGLLFGFVFAIDACLLALAWLDDDAPHVHVIGGFAVFGLLAIWTAARLTNDLLPWALGLYLVHGAIHTTFPLLLQRRRPGVVSTGWSQLFPPLALLLLLGPLLKLDDVSFALWPCVLIIDLLAITMAVVSGTALAAALAFVLTLAATVLWMLQIAPAPASESLLLLVLGGFALLFFAGGMFLAARPAAAGPQSWNRFGGSRAQLPAFSALMPFLLLVMMTQRLPLANPSGLFGLALVLVLMTLGLTVGLNKSRAAFPAVGAEATESTPAEGKPHPLPTNEGTEVQWLPLCVLAGVAMLEYAWDARHTTRSLATVPFAWYLLFYAAFSVFPFIFHRRFAASTGPWATAALAGVVQFPLIYWIVQRSAPDAHLGVVPALFAIAPLASFFALRRVSTIHERARLNQLAWFGGVALLFITLIVPIQFERQWITLGWALEGAALLWLCRRVPHAGLRATGAVLLVAAFIRLALNPAVLEYHERAQTPIFNWYLYAYGAVIAALFVGAMLSSPNDRTLGVRLPPLLYSLGTVLTFLLLNIQIADYFTPAGVRVLTFQFSGNFARDMTYTIAWALFALGLLLISIWRRTRAGRYGGLALLGVAVLKLFVHDLERLGALHRIGALFAVAIIAIVASVAYQRFLPSEDKPRQ